MALPINRRVQAIELRTVKVLNQTSFCREMRRFGSIARLAAALPSARPDCGTQKYYIDLRA